MTTLASVVIQSSDMRFASVFKPYDSPINGEPGYSISFPIGTVPESMAMHLPRTMAAARDLTMKTPGYVTARSKTAPLVVEINGLERELGLVMADAAQSRIPMDYLLTGTPVMVLVDVWEGGRPPHPELVRFDVPRTTLRTVGLDSKALAERLETVREIVRLDLAERAVFKQTHPTPRGWPLWDNS